MNEDDPNEEDAMEIEDPIATLTHVIGQPPEEILPLALVAIERLPITIEVDDNAVVVEIDSNEGSTNSATSSRAPTPSNFDEDSNQNEEVPSEAPEPSNSRKRTYSDDDNDDGAICPICLDNWTNTGEHRICALKCGHLFGHKCVQRWLQSQKRRTCPTCKKRVGRDDVRFIYAKKLIAVDTTELDNIKKQLDLVTEERNKAQTDLAKCSCREFLLTQEIAQLKAQLNGLNRIATVTSANSNCPIPKHLQYHMEKSIEVCKFGGSRVFDAKCELDLLMASLKSPSNLFVGYGLRKFNISNYRSTAFIPLHNAQIRDICFHQENNWVLTASMDKSFKVVDNNTNTVTYQFNHQMPLWSCCWDLNNPFVLYVGTQSGSVIQYDIRQLTDPVTTLSIEGDMSPVVSVASIPAQPGATLAQGGVVSCKLNSLWIYENQHCQHIRHPLSLEGPFVSMKYQPSSRQLLVSSRPNNRITYSRHTLCTLEKNDQQNIDCNIIHLFQGGGMQKLLSKSCFLSHTHEYVAAHQENNRSVFLWSINTGEKVCSIPAHETVLDLKGVQNHNGNFLVSLTEKKLEFFKFN